MVQEIKPVSVTPTEKNVSVDTAAPVPPASTIANEAAVVTLTDSSTYSLPKLEKHLKDASQGEGYKSPQGFAYTRKKTLETVSAFQDLGFESFDAITKFLSGAPSYSQRARAIEGLNRTAKTASQLKDVAQRLSALKKQA